MQTFILIFLSFLLNATRHTVTCLQLFEISDCLLVLRHAREIFCFVNKRVFKPCCHMCFPHFQIFFRIAQKLDWFIISVFLHSTCIYVGISFHLQQNHFKDDHHSSSETESWRCHQTIFRKSSNQQQVERQYSSYLLMPILSAFDLHKCKAQCLVWLGCKTCTWIMCHLQSANCRTPQTAHYEQKLWKFSLQKLVKLPTSNFQRTPN